MFAPVHHPAMKNVAPVRREMGVRTIFNILGPLTNPAGAPEHPDGRVPSGPGRHPGAGAAAAGRAARTGGLGRDGMDEMSLGAATLVGELRDGQVREYEIHPEDFGIAMAATRNLRVADAAGSRAMVLEVLDGRPGLPLEIVALNAGAALYVAGVADSIATGIQQAREAIASGAARERLARFVEATRAAVA
jgi:anthranilate phosphoribosyltransferase